MARFLIYLRCYIWRGFQTCFKVVLFCLFLHNSTNHAPRSLLQVWTSIQGWPENKAFLKEKKQLLRGSKAEEEEGKKVGERGGCLRE